MTKNEVFEALKAANTAPFEPARMTSGCGRAYVCVSTTTDKDTLKAVAAACKDLGLLFERKGHYGVGRNSIYIGYDNADGRALAKSRVFAKILTERGISAYDDTASD
jgi:hypothetical protein